MKKEHKRRKKGKMVVFAVLIVVILAAVAIVVSRNAKKEEPEIISLTALEKMVDVSDMSTFEAIYNGIAEVENEADPTQIDYYVSYEAKVKAGFDFESLNMQVDHDRKVITVKIPEIKITDVNVDIGSLDYIFENKKANTETVSEQAYKKCIEDVTKESAEEKAIYELAKQNAKNTMEAIIQPFMEQLDEEYQLQIE